MHWRSVRQWLCHSQGCLWMGQHNHAHSPLRAHCRPERSAADYIPTTCFCKTAHPCSICLHAPVAGHGVPHKHAEQPSWRQKRSTVGPLPKTCFYWAASHMQQLRTCTCRRPKHVSQSHRHPTGMAATPPSTTSDRCMPQRAGGAPVAGHSVPHKRADRPL